MTIWRANVDFFDCQDGGGPCTQKDLRDPVWNPKLLLNGKEATIKITLQNCMQREHNPYVAS